MMNSPTSTATSKSESTEQLVDEEAQTESSSDVPLPTTSISPVEEVSSVVAQQPDHDKKFTGASTGTAASDMTPSTCTPQRPRNCKAIASLVCASVGFLLFFTFIPIGMMLFPFAICLVVLAIHEMKQQEPDTSSTRIDITSKCMAILGLVTGITGFILSIMFIITYLPIFLSNNQTPE